MRSYASSAFVSVASGLAVWYMLLVYPDLGSKPRLLAAVIVGMLVLGFLLLRRQKSASGIRVGSDSKVGRDANVVETTIHAAPGTDVSVASGNKVGDDLNVRDTSISCSEAEGDAGTTQA